MAVHLLYRDFFRFLEELTVGLSDPWLVYEDLYLEPNRAALEAWWAQVLGLPREVWIDRVRRVHPQEYGLLRMVVDEGDLGALATEAMARCQAALPRSPEPDVYYVVGFFSPDGFSFQVDGRCAIGIGLERLHSQQLIPVLLAHEYLHCARAQLPRPRTLGERMVEEGFAAEFSSRVFPDRASDERLLMRTGQVAVMRQYEARLWEAVRPLLAETDEAVIKRVVFGQAEGREWPSRAGIYLGWRLVHDYLETHPGRWEAEAGEVLRGAGECT